MSTQDKVELLQWDDIPMETVNPSMRRQIITGELMTVARIYFKAGFLVPMHSHHNEQITQVISGVLEARNRWCRLRKNLAGSFSLPCSLFSLLSVIG